MSTKENRLRLLLLAIIGGLCIVLAVRFFFFNQETTRLHERISRIRNHVETRRSGAASTEESFFIPRKPDLTKSDGERSDWTFNGLSFYDLREIDRFFLEKIRDRDGAFEILPPRNLHGAPVRGGVKLVWSGNPLNGETIKKLAGNPLLQLRYKIYRWIKGMRPAVADVIPYEQKEYLDTTIDPAREEYYYCVLLILEGTAKENQIFIESKRSDVISVLSKDRFKIRVTGGSGETAFVSVTITDREEVYTESFVVEKGEKIGRPKDIAGKGTLDFFTGLILRSIRFEKEEREISTRVPEFNSDGSIRISATTRDPVYRIITENEPVQVISIECIDRKGRVRIFKES
jgi:hypothetical protein